MRRYHYHTCCIESKGEWINDMTQQARDVTLRTFRRNCAGVREWAEAHGYSRQLGISLCNDWHVSYHKSRYRGQPCYYVRWSAIEFIWTLGGAA